MGKRFPVRFFVGGLVCGLVLWARPAAADMVDAVWDLLTTVPPTTFGGAAFQGVPLGTFDFGGSIGVQPVGLTDTIVKRNAAADVPTPPGTDTVPIELVALHLQSVAPVDFGLGLDTYFVTLQAERGGPAKCRQHEHQLRRDRQQRNIRFLLRCLLRHPQGRAQRADRSVGRVAASEQRNPVGPHRARHPSDPQRQSRRFPQAVRQAATQSLASWT